MRNLTIKKKIILYISTITTLSLVFICVIVYTLFFQTLSENAIESTVKSSDITKHNVEFILKVVDNTATLLGFNKDVINELGKPHIITDTNNQETENKISTMLNNIISVQEYIKGIYIVGNEGSFYSSDWGIKENEVREKYNLQSYQNLSSDQYYTGVHQINYHLFSRSNVISYVRPIFLYPSEKNVGTIIIDLDYNYLKEMFTISSIQNDEKVLIVNPNGETIFVFPYLSNLDDIIHNNPDLLKLSSAKLNRTVFGKQSIIVSNTVEFSDWKIIRVISIEKIYKETNKLGYVAILISLFFILLSFSTSFALSIGLTKPILELDKKIKLVEMGDLSVNVKVKSRDELGHLSESFNNMVMKLKDLISKEVESQKKKSDMEFQILQAQINPHFLYNTLDSIRWLAAIQNISNIKNMATSLINLLRYNISRKEITVTLSEEIESVKNYVEIQKYKYGDLFNVNYSLHEGTAECKILRFSLQPIVENSIFHGFENIEGNGIIEISTFLSDGNLKIEISDNGVGTDSNYLCDIPNEQLQKKKFSGIGLRNIEDRIKLHFGEKYGLYFSSKQNQGTKVTLILPIIIENDRTTEV